MIEDKFRILAPLDGASASESAIEAVAPVARAWGLELALLRVEKEEADPTAAGHYLAGVRESLQKQGIRAGTHVWKGDPAEQILAFSAAADIRLIAMATHARKGIDRVVTGSVTESVLRKADIPVLAVRPGHAPGKGRLVVALDGSEASEQVVADAAAVAKALAVEVDLIRAALPIETAGGIGQGPNLYASEDPMPYLATVAERMAGLGIKARTFGPVGRAAEEVVRHATKEGASLICMTTHGRTGLSRIVLGSVAEEILRTAPCPVLIRRMTASPRPMVAGK